MAKTLMNTMQALPGRTGPLKRRTDRSAQIGDAAISKPWRCERNGLTVGLINAAAIGELNQGFRRNIVLACVGVAEESELHRMISESAQAPVPWPESCCALLSNKVNVLVVVATNHG